MCVDINVSEGTLAVLAQKVGRGGTVEWEVDDTDDFLAAYSKRHMLKQLAVMFTEELNEQVAIVAAESYRSREGEMVEATVVTEVGLYSCSVQLTHSCVCVEQHICSAIRYSMETEMKARLVSNP